ncbi:MFS transporter [Streptomyces sp. NPDC005244]|uniref:MFS transporter n=1 Tax=Streptomyces sp. NPDC005244 TaxID=3364708 RepID=UPI00367EB9D2
MQLNAYGRVLNIPGLRFTLALGFLAKIPVVTVPMIVTLHVTTGLHLGFGRAGAVVAAWTVGVALGAPFQGRYIDRRGLRPLLAVSTALQVIFYSLAPEFTYSVLLVTALLTGLLIVPGTTISRLVIACLVPEKQRHTAFALDSMLTNLSYMSGPALAVVLATNASTDVALRVVALLLLVSGAAILYADPLSRAERTGPPQPASSADSRSAMRPPLRQWLHPGLIGTFVCTLAAGMFSSGAEIGVIGALQRQGEASWLSPVMVAFGICSIGGGLVYGSLAKSPHAAAVVAVLGAVILPIGLLDAPWVALALLPAAILYAPAFAATASAAGKYSEPGTRASVMSLYSSAMTVGTALGGPMTGSALDRGGPFWAFAVLGSVILLISLAAFPAMRTHRTNGTARKAASPPSFSELAPSDTHRSS